MYEVCNCDNTERADTLAQACQIAEEWFTDNWDVRLNHLAGVDDINEQLRQAYGQGDCPDAGCPEIIALNE